MKSISFLGEFKKLVWLAIPMIVGEFTYALTPFINTIYMGHISDDTLAAGGLVGSLFAFIMVLFWGVFSMISSLIARHEGAKEGHLSSEIIKTGLILALVLSLPIMVVFNFSEPLLTLFGQKPNVIILCHQYLFALQFSVLPDFLLVVLYQFYYGISKPRVGMVFSFILVPLNLLVNYALIFGAWGFPDLGIAGAGWGSSICYWIILILFTIYIYRFSAVKHYFSGKRWFYKSHAIELFKTGIPLGMMWVFEIGFFMVITLFMGYLSDTALAAHQIVFQTYMIFFNILYSFSQAVAVRVGDGIGRKLKKQVLHAYWGGCLFAGIFTLLMLLLVILGRPLLIHFFLGDNYNADTAVVALAMSLFWTLPLCFLFDSSGYITLASLRSFKDTRYSLWVAIISYWLIALPITAVLLFYFHSKSPMMLWWMTFAGVFLSFLGQAARFRYQYRKLA